MFYTHRKSLSPITSSFTSVSSDNSNIPKTRSSPSATLRQLVAYDLDETNSRDWSRSPSRQQGLLRIPRPALTIPYPAAHGSTDNSLWTPRRGPAPLEEVSSSSDPSTETYFSERPFYQIALPPSPSPPPIQYQIRPASSQQIPSIHTHRKIKKKKYVQENTVGLCSTLCSGGLGTVAALIYLSFCLALPTVKLTLGIIHRENCPLNTRIPLYMIVSGACGLGLILLLLFSSTCTFYRSLIRARKSTHKLMICSIAFARGTQGVIAIFLFIWFIFGNVWVFGAQVSLQTTDSTNNNYCDPILYRFAYYFLIFTYVFAIFLCFLRFCANFCCCRACDIWKRAFS